MYKFEDAGTLGDILVQKMISLDSNESYVKLIKLQSNGHTKQSIIIPFEHVHKLKDILNDLELYATDVGYSIDSLNGFNTTTSRPLHFKSEVLRPEDLSQLSDVDNWTFDKMIHDSDQVAVRTSFQNQLGKNYVDGEEQLNIMCDKANFKVFN